MIAGVMNAIAGGGTLLTFPALVALGVPPIHANATSTVALWPGSMGSIWGYRKVLQGSRVWGVGLAIPSLLGGIVGALLLLRTPAERFNTLVPWLVLGATALFVIQRPLVRWIERRGLSKPETNPKPDDEIMRHRPPLNILAYQFLVAVYGGYFGAG